MHDLVSSTSGPAIVVLALAALAGFVIADLVRAAGGGPEALRRARTAAVAAWPLAILTLVVALIRVVVLA